jgi:hypothetical protein
MPYLANASTYRTSVTQTCFQFHGMQEFSRCSRKEQVGLYMIHVILLWGSASLAIASLMLNDASGNLATRDNMAVSLSKAPTVPREGHQQYSVDRGCV